MATVPVPRTWAASEQATDAKFNADIRDGLSFFYSPPRAKFGFPADLVVPTGVITPVPWTTEYYDSDNGHSTSTNPARYVAQTAGWYHLFTTMRIDLSSGSSEVGGREIGFRKNGSDSLRQNRQDGYVYNRFSDDCFMCTAGHMQLNVGDYVEVITFNDTGNNVFVRTFAESPPYFTVRWVRT